MNAEQKQRAKDALTNCQASDMAALLQELIDMPEVLAATNPAQISSLPAGGKLVPVEPTPEMIDAWNNDDSDEFRHAYRAMLEAAPPTPSVPDEQLQAAFDRGLKAGNEQSVAQQIEIHKLHDSLAAPQPEPLSDERIFKLFLEKAVDKGTAGIYDFARALEREIMRRKAIDVAIAAEKGGAA